MPGGRTRLLRNLVVKRNVEKNHQLALSPQYHRGNPRKTRGVRLEASLYLEIFRITRRSSTFTRYMRKSIEAAKKCEKKTQTPNANIMLSTLNRKNQLLSYIGR